MEIYITDDVRRPSALSKIFASNLPKLVSDSLPLSMEAVGNLERFLDCLSQIRLAPATALIALDLTVPAEEAKCQSQPCG